MGKSWSEEIELQEREMLLMHSKKLKQTVAFSVARNPGEPLSGTVLKYPVEKICEVLEGSGIHILTRDFDQDPDIIVTGILSGQKTDYSLGVEEVGKELKLVILPTLSMERETKKDKKEPEKEEQYLYMEY